MNIQRAEFLKKIMKPMKIKEVKADEGIDEPERELRDAPPLHYLFKIENYSLISDAKMDKYESTDFEVGGYQWTLVIYPKGSKKVKENDHLSMYLKLSSSNAFPLRREVLVYFKFFVYNKLIDKYLTIHDGKVRRFRATKSKWGFDKILPLHVFNDVSKGYLASDCCIFGAEIFILDSPTDKGEHLFVMKELGKKNSYTWNVKDFARLMEEVYTSEIFIIGGYKWCIDLFPNGDSDVRGKNLSMYLALEDDEALDTGEILQANYTLRVKNHGDENEDYEETGPSEFCASSNCWGSCDFIPLSNLKDMSTGYMNGDGTVIVEAEIHLLTLIKDTSDYELLKN